MSWVVETGEGRSFVVAGAVSNSATVLDEAEAVQLFGFIRDRVDDLTAPAG